MKTFKAKVKATGKLVTVYKLQRGGYCDFSDCTTEYKESDLEFINQ